MVVKLNKIYTRTGDDGSTGLVDGTRLSKHSLRVAAYGDVDETNATLGLARLDLTSRRVDAMLARIQNELFDLGADLATPLPSDGAADAEYALRIIPSQTERLEAELDALNADMPALSSFILPGGSAPAARLHLARTVARRAERTMVALSNVEDVNPEALRYINRLSDFLFVAARWCNDQGERDVLWKAGGTRGE